MEKCGEKITGYSEERLFIIERARAGIEKITNQVLSGEIDILYSTIEMNKLSRETVNSVVESVSDEFNLNAQQQTFAIFFFGSPSRNLMLPNSDLDVGLIFADDCPEEIKVSLRDVILSLPFDKVDIASWHAIDAMRKDNCPDMIEYNKAIDAKFVAGNPIFSSLHSREIKNSDTRSDKINRFVTEYGLLHRYDYLSKKTDHGPNLKYDFGASRDVIFLDWYFMIANEQVDLDEDHPVFESCLELLLKNGSISERDHENLVKSIELILLTKFTLLSKFRKSNNKTLIHLSNFAIHEAYREAPQAFKNLGIYTGDQLVLAYYDAKLLLYATVDDLYKTISADSELPAVWEMAEDKRALDSDVRQLLAKKTWYNLVPFAVCSSSPEILDFITRSIADLPGYEYILRIVSENKSLNNETKKILLNSNLADKFKEKLIVTTKL